MAKKGVKMAHMNEMAKHTEYVVGLLFSASRKSVVLIKKNRPKWQKGLWNGVGGHVEPGEQPLDAMRREFLEETGMAVDDWEHRVVYMGGDYRIDFYYAVHEYIWHVKTITDERVQAWLLNDLPQTVPNLRWLIPVMLDPDILVMEVDSKHADVMLKEAENG